MTDAPRPGDIWRYPYLWARQAQRGETEGRKARPTVIAVAMRRIDGRNGLALLAVTSQQPDPDRRSLEIPETERRRANLDEDQSLWVILDEHNLDIFETSYYLEPEARLGSLGAKFRKQVQAAFVDALRHRKSRPVRRTDD